MIRKMSLSLILISTVLFAKEVVWDFENTSVGEIPKQWTVAATHPKDPLASWQVTKEKGGKALTLSKINAPYGSTFNLCFMKSFAFKDGEISVKFRANSGEIDQGGGIMWRARDKDNYLVARFNPLEDNFRFYSVIDGNRHELASADVKLSKGWHTMKIVQKGEDFTGYLDDKQLLSYKDVPLKEAGGVGVWTKSDAATSFDDFKVK